mmetsp:Transcript_11178/g.38894  ORF Transcript_11178/g.38894 Transcript_11178/m.38894 type:complete len:322 (-) Transcript_11178:196-1161(-)
MRLPFARRSNTEPSRGTPRERGLILGLNVSCSWPGSRRVGLALAERRFAAAAAVSAVAPTAAATSLSRRRRSFASLRFSTSFSECVLICGAKVSSRSSTSCMICRRCCARIFFTSAYLVRLATLRVRRCDLLLILGWNVTSSSCFCACSCRIWSIFLVRLRMRLASRSGNPLFISASSRLFLQICGVKRCPRSSSAMRACSARMSSVCFSRELDDRRTTRSSHSPLFSLRCGLAVDSTSCAARHRSTGRARFGISTTGGAAGALFFFAPPPSRRRPPREPLASVMVRLAVPVSRDVTDALYSLRVRLPLTSEYSDPVSDPV